VAKQKQQTKKKLSPLEAVLAVVREGYGKESARTLGEGARGLVEEVIPFGIAALDHYVCGCGGLPVGRLTELFSEEGGGKSSLTLAALASAQREGGIAILSESEHGLDESRVKVFGVQPDNLGLLQPDYMEQAVLQMEAALNAIPKGVGPNLLAWDSVAATQTKGEYEGGLDGDAVVAERARLLSKACRILLPLASEKRTALLFVNQTREKIGVVFGDRTTTPGGKGVKFAASLRIQLFGGKSIKDGVQHTGKIITVMGVKNRFAPPYRKVRVRLDYATGFNDVWTTINHAKELGVLPAKATGNKAHTRAVEHFTDMGWNMGGRVDGKNVSEDDINDAKRRLGADQGGDDDDGGTADDDNTAEA
jgi:recombination protein RecA